MRGFQDYTRQLHARLQDTRLSRQRCTQPEHQEKFQPPPTTPSNPHSNRDWFLPHMAFFYREGHVVCEGGTKTLQQHGENKSDFSSILRSVWEWLEGLLGFFLGCCSKASQSIRYRRVSRIYTTVCAKPTAHWLCIDQAIQPVLAYFLNVWD